MYEAYIYRRSDTKQERDRVRFRSRKSSYPQGILRMAYEMARDHKPKAIAIDLVADGIREPIQTAYWDRDQRFVRYHRTGRYKDNTINRLMSDGTVRFLEYGPRQYSRDELPLGCNKCVNNYITYNNTVINKPTVVKKKVVKKKVVKRVRSGGGSSGGYDLGYAGAYRLPATPSAPRIVRTQDTTQVQLQREARRTKQAELQMMKWQDKQERRKAKQERKQQLKQQRNSKRLPEGPIDVDYRIIEEEPKRENMRLPQGTPALPSQREIQAKYGLPMPNDAEVIDADYRVLKD